MIGVVLGTGWDVEVPTGIRQIERRHLYDGFSADESVRLIADAIEHYKVTTLVLTSASGAVNPDLEVGEVICITDHINLSGWALSVGFQPMHDVYQTVGDFRHGVYAQVRGPVFETPAEARMLRTVGADVVGMSTALEATMAHRLGSRVVGLSLVTNHSGTSDGHEDVLAMASKVDLQDVLDKVLEEL